MSATEAFQMLPVHHLGERLYAYTRLRYAVAAVMVAGAVFGRYVVGIEDLSVAGFAAMAIFLAGCNVATARLVRPCVHPERAAARRRMLTALTHFTVLVDFLCLTVAVWLLGGARSPFQTFFLLHLVIACVMLPRRVAWAYAMLAWALLALLVLGEWLRWFPAHTPEGAVLTGPITDARYVLTLLAVQAVLFALVTYLLTQLAGVMRSDHRKLRQAYDELERLSALRRDFLHIAMHNLRSPIGAVTMLMHNLETEPLSERQSHWVGRSKHRLEELSAFLHDLQTLTSLESGALEDQFASVDLAALLRDLVAENQDLAQAHGHALELSLDGALPSVPGNARLLREAIVNFLTNAIKYTPDGGHIEVRGAAASGAVVVEVEDNGIGIPADQRDRLFGEFVRIRRERSPVGDVPGTGLGLSIARRIIDAHHGCIDVRTEPGVGSTFTIRLPAVAGSAPGGA